jgi:hypothetical protein
MITGMSDLGTFAALPRQRVSHGLLCSRRLCRKGISSKKEKLENPVEDDQTDDNVPAVLLDPLHIEFSRL